jgi:hypothetical protein
LITAIFCAINGAHPLTVLKIILTNLRSLQVKTNSCSRLQGLCAVVFLAVVAMTLPFTTHAGDKLKPEEIVAKNLESIGSAEARAKVTNRIVGGSVVATFAEPKVGQFKGQAVLASEGDKNLISMQFSNTNYSQENISFNGQDALIGFVRAGVRSNLGDFLWTYKTLIKQGLVGGELSQAWPLYDLADKKPKLSGGGAKKIGDREVYEIKLMPRGGSDMEISIFFDTQTFQHVRTEYNLVVRPQIGLTVDANKSQTPSRYNMTEEFADFKKEGDLTLPHSYKITLGIDRYIAIRNNPSATTHDLFRGNWELTLDQFGFNQPIPPETFSAVVKE